MKKLKERIDWAIIESVNDDSITVIQAQRIEALVEAIFKLIL